MMEGSQESEMKKTMFTDQTIENPLKQS